MNRLISWRKNKRIKNVHSVGSKVLVEPDGRILKYYTFLFTDDTHHSVFLDKHDFEWVIDQYFHYQLSAKLTFQAFASLKRIYG